VPINTREYCSNPRRKLVKKMTPKLKSCNEMGQNFNPRKMILLEIRWKFFLKEQGIGGIFPFDCCKKFAIKEEVSAVSNPFQIKFIFSFPNSFI
jgi:hypothetical protein